MQLAAALWRHERGAGVIRLPAERAVELGRVPDRFMDREPEIGRVEDEVVTAGRRRLRASFSRASPAARAASSARPRTRRVLPPRGPRRGEAVAAREFAGVLVHRGGAERGIAPQPGLENGAAARRGEEFPLADEIKARVAEIGTGLQRRLVDREEMRRLDVGGDGER